MLWCNKCTRPCALLGSLVVTCVVTGSSASTLGTNKVLCGVAICLCVAKLWLEHWPCVAKATQADLSCLASNSWSKSLVVFSPPLVLVELVACLSTWSFLLVDLQATLFIQAASGTCLVDGNSSPYTFCNHMAPISTGLVGYVLGPAICWCMVLKHWVCKEWKSAKQLWMTMAFGSGLPSWLWQYKARATAWALFSLKLTTPMVASLLAITCMWSYMVALDSKWITWPALIILITCDGLSGSNSQLMSKIPLLVQVVTAWIFAHHVETRHWTTGLPALFCCKAARWVSSSLKSGIVLKWLMAKKRPPLVLPGPHSGKELDDSVCCGPIVLVPILGEKNKLVLPPSGLVFHTGLGFWPGLWVHAWMSYWLWNGCATGAAYGLKIGIGIGCGMVGGCPHPPTGWNVLGAVAGCGCHPATGWIVLGAVACCGAIGCWVHLAVGFSCGGLGLLGGMLALLGGVLGAILDSSLMVFWALALHTPPMMVLAVALAAEERSGLPPAGLIRIWHGCCWPVGPPPPWPSAPVASKSHCLWLVLVKVLVYLSRESR